MLRATANFTHGLGAIDYSVKPYETPSEYLLRISEAKQAEINLEATIAEGRARIDAEYQLDQQDQFVAPDWGVAPDGAPPPKPPKSFSLSTKLIIGGVVALALGQVLLHELNRSRYRQS
jgi:hypothetical protein